MTASSETSNLQDDIASFDRRFSITHEPVMRRVEQRVLGSDYGGSSFTTLERANRLATALELGPGKSLLDVGSGAGWPGVYLGRITGCRVLLSDLSSEGPKVAAARIEDDEVEGVTFTASGLALPLRSDQVDAVTCSDVFC